MAESETPASQGFQGSPAAMRRRVRALDAFIDLVLEGHPPPTVEQVIDRAGISQATFFRYFESLCAMRYHALARMLERFPFLHLEDPGQGPLDGRIERFVASYVAWWEKTHRMAFLQRSMVLEDPEAARMVDGGRQRMAGQIREHFASELREHSQSRRDERVALIAMLTSVESWDQLRNVYGLSPLQTRRAWTQAIDALLRTAGP